jgi:UDP-N-acetylmuramate dehydrogenase
MTTLTPDTLPRTRGRYRFDADLSKSNWFQVGGKAEVLFKPEDAADLAHFIKHKPAGVPVTLLGVGSNMIIRDGGIKGVVIRLGRGFAQCMAEGEQVTAGAACLDVHIAKIAADAGLSGLEFLSGIPGTLGGALAMNGGAYGSDISQVATQIECVDEQGEIRRVPPTTFQYGYRHAQVPPGWIFTGATLQGKPGDKDEILARMAQIQTEREASQPIRSRTGGSTFKNPPSHKAWELVDAAGCRGLRVGDAEMSEKHCNFMINHGNATAADLENLGEEVRRRVQQKTGILLEWEIKRIGCKA